MPLKNSSIRVPYGRRGPLWTWLGYHTGDDWNASMGTPVYATAAGRVDRVYYDQTYGYYVRIYHGSGVHSWYCHLSRQAVRMGTYVKAGTYIARTGSSGNVTGPHLHYEERYLNRPRKPQLYAGKAHIHWKRLRYGQKDSRSVSHLQRRLNAILKNDVRVTGNYGDETKAAVARYQRRQGWSGNDANGLIYPSDKDTARRLFPSTKYILHWD